MKIRVKRINKKLPVLDVATNAQNWIDLRASKKMNYRVSDFLMIPLGIAMELPEGYEAHVAPRSSTFKNYGLIQVNSLGIIDNSYCGDNDQWMFPALATRNGVVEEGDRICQFRIVKKQPTFEFEDVECLGNEDRSGFGSTGVK